MGSLYKTISDLCEAKGISVYRMCKDISMQPSVMTDLKKGRKQTLHPDSLSKVAVYFGVTVDYLLGNEKSAPVDDNRDAALSEDDKRMQRLNSKIALLSDSKRAVLEELLDAMLEK